MAEKQNVFKRIGIEPIDIFIFLFVFAFLYGLIHASQGITFEHTYNPTISLSPMALPFYAWLSILRQLFAFGLSLIFAVIYGYVASHNRKAEGFMIPLLDIMQSIPLISFLPIFVLSLIRIFPVERIGIEIACILLIFTSQSWNMAFSVYGSMKSIPKDYNEAGSIFRFTKSFKFWFIELPNSVIGLVWNSMMSVAGGWFFLMASEMFVLGGRDFRLPGLGSYLMLAAIKGDTKAIFLGLSVIIGIIVLVDQLVWRPLIAWSQRFKHELNEEEDPPRSFLLTQFRRSKLLDTTNKWSDRILQRITKPGLIKPFIPEEISSKKKNDWILSVVMVLIGIFATYEFIRLLSGVRAGEWLTVFGFDILTFLRVTLAVVLSCLWTVPVGIAIGMNKKLSNRLQPIVQIFASVPATAVFPIILLTLIQLRGGLFLASLLLMMLGTQWYILFNVIAGAQSIPTDLKEASTVFHLSGWKKFRTLLLPSIMPSLVTGLITATGGAWNASIVSEYISFNEKVYIVPGIGSLISQSANKGNFSLLAAGTFIMVITVIIINRFIWRKMYWKSIEHIDGT
jgi:NitT/TauT family transport system permease protein